MILIECSGAGVDPPVALLPPHSSYTLTETPFKLFFGGWSPIEARIDPPEVRGAGARTVGPPPVTLNSTKAPQLHVAVRADFAISTIFR